MKLTFFLISTFVFSRIKKWLQVWNNQSMFFTYIWTTFVVSISQVWSLTVGCCHCINPSCLNILRTISFWVPEERYISTQVWLNNDRIFSFRLSDWQRKKICGRKYPRESVYPGVISDIEILIRKVSEPKFSYWLLCYFWSRFTWKAQAIEDVKVGFLN